MGGLLLACCIQVHLNCEEKKRLADDTEYSTWRMHSKRVKHKHGLAENFRPWTSRPEVHLSGVPDSERQRDCIDTWLGAYMAQEKKKLNTRAARQRQGRQGQHGEVPLPDIKTLTQRLFCDTSQAVHRGNVLKGRPGVLCQSSQVYSYEKDIVLTGRNHLRLMGWGDEVKAAMNFSDNELRAMAGQSYSCPWIAALHYCVWANPYHQRWAPASVDAEQQGDVMT